MREWDAAAANERHQLIRLLHPLDLSFIDQHPVPGVFKKAVKTYLLAFTTY